jgi:hypothetical protein
VAEPSRVRPTAPVAIVLATALAGCVLPGSQGDPSAPILITGRVQAADGTPVSGAALELWVTDFTGPIVQAGEQPTIFRHTYASGADGTFALHLAPTPDLLALAGRSRGSLSFNLLASWGSTPRTIAFSTFARDVGGNAWAGDIPAVVLEPGSSVTGRRALASRLPAMAS